MKEPDIKIPKNVEEVKEILYKEIGLISYLCDTNPYDKAITDLIHALCDLSNTILYYENL